MKFNITWVRSHRPMRDCTAVSFIVVLPQSFSFYCFYRKDETEFAQVKIDATIPNTFGGVTSGRYSLTATFQVDLVNTFHGDVSPFLWQIHLFIDSSQISQIECAR